MNDLNDLVSVIQSISTSGLENDHMLLKLCSGIIDHMQQQSDIVAKTLARTVEQTTIIDGLLNHVTFLDREIVDLKKQVSILMTKRQVH